LSAADKLFHVSRLNVPIQPTLQRCESVMPASVERKIREVKQFKLEFIKVASKALEILKSYISVRLQNISADLLSSEFITARDKLLAMWDWLCSLRVNNNQVIQDINTDIANLPGIDDFNQAVANIDAMNLLQQELLTMNSGLSDSNLIMSHTTKLSHSEMFRSLKINYLQNDNQHTETNGPVLRRIQQHQPPLIVQAPAKSWKSEGSQKESSYRQ
jgi:hypothetical protein